MGLRLKLILIILICIFVFPQKVRAVNIEVGCFNNAENVVKL